MRPQGRRGHAAGLGGFRVVRDDRNLKLHCTPTAASLTVLVDGGVDGGLGSYSGVWTAHRRAVPRRNLSLIEKINALPGPTLPSSLLKFRVPA